MIGGARRVGRAISLGLAEAGADVALTAHSSTGDGEATAQAIRALGRRSVALACDVRSIAEIDRAVGAAAEELDGLDVLVYAAGAAFRGVAPEKVDLELFDEAIETILQGAFFAAQSAHQHMQESGGVIVFITDVAGIAAVAIVRPALGREGRPHPPDPRPREGVGPVDPGLRRRSRHGA